MSLKAVLTSIEGLAEDIVAHYKEKDGKFYLDVTSVDGLALEDVTALKTTIKTLRTSEKTLRKDVETGENALRKHEAKFEGVDPKAAKEAIRLASHKLPIKTRFISREIDAAIETDSVKEGVS